MKLTTAIAKIQDLEDLLAHYVVVTDLLEQENEDKEELIRSLKGQLQILRIDRRYEVG